MKPYAKFKLTLKFLLIFMSTALITGILGFMAIRNLGKLNRMLTNVYDESLLPIVYISDANVELTNHNRRLCIYVLLSERNEREFFWKKMLESKAKVVTYIGMYRKTHLTDEEKNLLAEFDRTWPVYLSHVEKTLSLSQAGKRQEAESLAIGDTRLAFQTADDKLVNLVKINRDQAKRAYEESNSLYTRNRTYFAGLVILCVLLTLGIGVLISVLITTSTIDL